MKAAIYNGIRDVSVIDLPMMECGGNDIVIKNIFSCICGSDITAYNHGGDSVRIFKGFEFGHEMVSEVVAVGSNITDIEVGDRVYPYPRNAKDDMTRAATVGGFSEYVLIPNCELNKSVFMVNDDISSREAALIEPFTVGTHAARRANPQKGQSAVVFGAGAIGIAAAVALKYWGVEKILVVDMSDLRLGIAKNLGFEICNSAKEDLVQKVQAIFGKVETYPPVGVNVDIYIDAVGATSVIDQWRGLATVGSKLVVVGVHHEAVPMALSQLTFYDLEVIGSAGYNPEDVLTVMEIMESGQFDLKSVITQEYDLEHINEALVMASNPNESLKVQIKF